MYQTTYTYTDPLRSTNTKKKSQSQQPSQPSQPYSQPNKPYSQPSHPNQTRTKFQNTFNPSFFSIPQPRQRREQRYQQQQQYNQRQQRQQSQFRTPSQSLFSNKMQIPNFGINYWNSIGDRHHTSQLLILLNSINTEIETITKDVDRQKFREEMEDFINEKDKKKLTTKYRKFSKKYHPDRNINNIDNANIKFKILGNIYEFILNDNVLIL